MSVKMLIATSTDYGIGLDNKLPWHCPEDLQYFKKVTDNDVVVMGRKTYESLPMYPKGLPNRKNIVITSEGSTCVGCNKRFVSKCNNIPWFIVKGLDYYKRKKKDVTIIGGATIYKEMLPVVEEIHHTIIRGEYECDTFFDMSFLYNGEWHFEDCEELSEMAMVNVWKRKEV